MRPCLSLYLHVFRQVSIPLAMSPCLSRSLVLISLMKRGQGRQHYPVPVYRSAVQFAQKRKDKGVKDTSRLLSLWRLTGETLRRCQVALVCFLGTLGGYACFKIFTGITNQPRVKGARLTNWKYTQECRTLSAEHYRLINMQMYANIQLPILKQCLK